MLEFIVILFAFLCVPLFVVAWVAPRKNEKIKSFGTITSVEGRRTIWISTVKGRKESRAIKNDPRILRSRYDSRG